MVNFTNMEPLSDNSYSGYRWLAREQDDLLSGHNRKMWRQNDDDNLARQIWNGTEMNWVEYIGDYIMMMLAMF